MSVSEQLADIDGAILLADGFDEALLGFVEVAGRSMVALYDRNKCIEILMSDGMDDEVAQEYFEFNVIGAYVGEYTPAFATFLSGEETNE